MFFKKLAAIGSKFAAGAHKGLSKIVSTVDKGKAWYEKHAPAPIKAFTESVLETTPLGAGLKKADDLLRLAHKHSDTAAQGLKGISEGKSIEEVMEKINQAPGEAAPPPNPRMEEMTKTE